MTTIIYSMIKAKKMMVMKILSVLGQDSGVEYKETKINHLIIINLLFSENNFVQNSSNNYTTLS